MTFFLSAPMQSMMRIAICDDEPQALQQLVAMTEDYLDSRKIDAEIRAFDHPDTLLTAIETQNFHLYLLDIVMPMANGIELGKEIRRLDREAQIVFATTEPQFALQAYAANPAGYLVKPVDRRALADTLAFALEKAERADARTIAVRTADGLRVLDASGILCCEYRNHAAVFTLSGGETLTSRTFRENFPEYCAPLLGDRHFLQCHAAFVVNMRRVESFAKDRFTLRGGKQVPIAPARYPAVRDAYLDYLTAGGTHG